MILGLNSVQAFWATNAPLNALIDSSNVYIDIADSNTPLPFAVLSQVPTDKINWQTNGDYLSEINFRIISYADTSLQLDDIVKAIINAFCWKDISNQGFGARLMYPPILRQEVEGAYSCVTQYLFREKFQLPL